MRKVISLILTCVITISVFCAPLTAEALTYTPDFEVVSQSAYLVNTDTGKVLYEKEAQKQLIPASLTKMITCIVALEHCEDIANTMVTAPNYVFDNLYGKGASDAGIMAGETLSMEDLLYGLMLPSGCEAADIIADYISGGKPEEFIQMMNDKAKEIGCTNTVFYDASGLDNRNLSTAYDMYLIANYGMNMEDGRFATISTTVRHTMKATNKQGERTITHSNYRMLVKSLGGDKYFYEYVKGIKTGTGDDYKNLVTAASHDGYNYICVVMGAPIRDGYGNELPQYTCLDSKNLYKWAFHNFSLKTVAEPNSKTIPNQIKVELAKDTDTIQLTTKETITELLPNDIDVSSIMWDTSNLPKTIQAPIKQGQEIGTIDLKLQNEVIQTVTVVAANDIDRSMWLYIGNILKKILTSWWFILLVVIIVVLLILYFVMVVVYNKRRRKGKIPVRRKKGQTVKRRRR